MEIWQAEKLVYKDRLQGTDEIFHGFSTVKSVIRQGDWFLKRGEG